MALISLIPCAQPEPCIVHTVVTRIEFVLDLRSSAFHIPRPEFMSRAERWSVPSEDVIDMLFDVASFLTTYPDPTRIDP